jgi:hypothetical protein
MVNHLRNSKNKIFQDDLFDKISQKLINHYCKGEILSILAYGNRVHNPQLVDEYSDFDITVIFKNYPNKSLPILPAKANLTTLFWPDLELCGVKNFRLENHREFYIIVLSEAMDLYGENPFKKLKKKLSQQAIAHSLKEQILFHCSKLSSNIMSYKKSDRKKREVTKYSFRIAQNFFFLKNARIDYLRFFNNTYKDWIIIFEEGDTFTKPVLSYLNDLISGNKEIENKDVFNYMHLIKKEVLKFYEQR